MYSYFSNKNNKSTEMVSAKYGPYVLLILIIFFNRNLNKSIWSFITIKLNIRLSYFNDLINRS